jgi:predicted transcriptional regulator
MGGKDTALRRLVQAALREQGLTLKEACAQANITPMSAQNWMNGLAARADNRARFLKVLGITDGSQPCPTCKKPM